MTALATSPFFTLALRDRLLDRDDDDVADRGVLALRAAEHLDAHDLLGARVVGDVQDRLHLNHGLVSVALLRFARALDQLRRRASACPSTAGASRRCARGRRSLILVRVSSCALYFTRLVTYLPYCAVRTRRVTRDDHRLLHLVGRDDADRARGARSGASIRPSGSASRAMTTSPRLAASWPAACSHPQGARGQHGAAARDLATRAADQVRVLELVREALEPVLKQLLLEALDAILELARRSTRESVPIMGIRPSPSTAPLRATRRGSGSAACGAPGGRPRAPASRRRLPSRRACGPGLTTAT